MIDTHCHLDLIEEEGFTASDALEAAALAGLEAVVQIATDDASSEFGFRLAQKWNQSSAEKTGLRLYWTAGLHPENGDRHDLLPAIIKHITDHRDDSDFMGIGEIGLDYFHSTDTIADQKETLQQLFDLAVSLQLPVIVHTRDDKQFKPGSNQAIHDVLAEVKKRPGLHGVLHCFTYSYEEAMPFVDLGWRVSFSGIVTFKNSHYLHESAVKLPLSSLLVETDAPFLSPVPYRGKPNQPAYVAHTLDFLVNLRSVTLGEDKESIRSKIQENSLAFIQSKHNLNQRAKAR